MSSAVARIALNDPGEGRRLSGEECDALRGRLRAATREAPRCLVLDVEGAAWHHGPEWPALGPDGGNAITQSTAAGTFHALIEQLFSYPAPVLVSVAGPVSGFGLGLALAADLRLATPEATFSLGGPAGAAALLGGTNWLMARAVGSATLAHLAWTGAVLDAGTARDRGLLSSVSEEAGAEAEALAQRLAELPAATTSAMKRALTSRQRPDLAAALDYESWLVEIATGAAREA